MTDLKLKEAERKRHKETREAKKQGIAGEKKKVEIYVYKGDKSAMAKARRAEKRINKQHEREQG